MHLTDTTVRKSRAAHSPFKLSDGRGLYLLVQPTGSKYWRFKYRFGGKEKVLALGVYPDVSLATARERREEARKALSSAVDPGAVKKAAKRSKVAAVEDTFQAVAQEWFAKYSPSWAENHAYTVIRRLERDIFPWLGQRLVGDISAPELLAVLHRIEARGAIETAHRALQNSGQVFRYAVATGRAQRDCSRDLRGALPPVHERHLPAITESNAIGDLLRSVAGYQGNFVTRCALRLAPLVFVRPGELRHAEWAEFSLDEGLWGIPSEKTKMRRAHLIPLATQAVGILRELRPLTGGGKYVFPGVRSATRPMSANTVNAALRRLGYDKHTMTGHGFRSMASTALNEQGWNRDVIERQLAHVEGNAVRGAYNRAEWLDERRRMMQAWADYLDALTLRADVVPIRKSG